MADLVRWKQAGTSRCFAVVFSGALPLFCRCFQRRKHAPAASRGAMVARAMTAQPSALFMAQEKSNRRSSGRGLFSPICQFLAQHSENFSVFYSWPSTARPAPLCQRDNGTPLPAPKPDRDHVRPNEKLAQHRNTLRPMRKDLPLSRSPRRNCHLLALTINES